MRRTNLIGIYIPLEPGEFGLTPGAAIVGSIIEGHAVVSGTTVVAIDYVNKDSQQPNTSFQQRVAAAATKHHMSDPAPGRKYLPIGRVKRVAAARFNNDAGWIIEQIDDPVALRLWLGNEPLPNTEPTRND